METDLGAGRAKSTDRTVGTDPGKKFFSRAVLNTAQMPRTVEVVVDDCFARSPIRALIPVLRGERNSARAVLAGKAILLRDSTFWRPNVGRGGPVAKSRPEPQPPASLCRFSGLIEISGNRCHTDWQTFHM